MLIGATIAFINKVNYVKNQITKDYDTTPSVANYYRLNNISSLIVGDETMERGHQENMQQWSQDLWV